MTSESWEKPLPPVDGTQLRVTTVIGDRVAGAEKTFPDDVITRGQFRQTMTNLAREVENQIYGKEHR